MREKEILLERLLQFKRLCPPITVGVFSGISRKSWRKNHPGVTHDLGDGIQISIFHGVWIICCSGGPEQQHAVAQLCREHIIEEKFLDDGFHSDEIRLNGEKANSDERLALADLDADLSKRSKTDSLGLLYAGIASLVILVLYVIVEHFCR